MCKARLVCHHFVMTLTPMVAIVNVKTDHDVQAVTVSMNPPGSKEHNVSLLLQRVIHVGLSLSVAAMMIVPAVEPVQGADGGESKHQITEDEDRIRIVTPDLSAAVKQRGYVSGIEAGSLVDKKTGQHDLGYGLDIVDWIMEPGSDAAYRDQLKGDLKYEVNNVYHGKTHKRSIEGPQI